MRIENMGRQPCSTGLDQGVAVMLAYIFGWISGLIFYFVEKQNQLVRFSAMQSIVLSAAWFAVMLTLSILSSVPLLGIFFRILNGLFGLGFFALIVVLIIQGFKGKRVVVPFLGELADRWSQPQA